MRIFLEAGTYTPPDGGDPNHWVVQMDSDDLSLGTYSIPAGGVDDQQPHTEDEIYYVVAGRGRITVGDEVRDVRPGSIVFVGTAVPHHFHDITEELTLLVAFGPAEGSRANR